MKIASINPYDNKVVKKFKELKDKELDERIRNAVNEFDSWKNTPAAARSRYLKSIAEILHADKRSYASIITTEMGKPVKEAIAEIEKCALLCEFYSEHSAHWLNDEKVQSEASSSYIAYEPLGVVF